MCGIGALLDPGRTAGDAILDAGLAALRHRGPDGEEARRLGPVALLHTRLAIIDPAGGHQPLASEDGGVVTVVNGELYNHAELRAGLEERGHTFATDSDSEVVVHLYEEEGPDCVARLNGMFGLAIWDVAEERLVLARDPFGVKPLYWWTDGTRVAGASEIGAVLALSGVRPELDPVALDHFLAWRFVPAPRTLFAGVRKVPAAGLVIADAGGVRERSFRTAPGPALERESPGELAGELARRLRAAVQRQLMSDVPLGAFLSGGVDSAAIASLMRRDGEPPPRTYTIGFPGHEAEVDERDAAAATARALGTHHAATVMDEGDYPRWIARSVEHLEEPSGIPSAPALLQVSGFARREVKVVLSGQGADEPLGGYQRHQAAAALSLARAVPGPLARAGRAAAARLPRNERAKRAASLLGEGDEQAALLRIFEIAPPGLRAELTGRDGEEAAAERSALAAGVLADVGDQPLLDRALYLDAHLFLPDGLLTYGDKMSMAHALEQRVPFLDLELTAFSERIPGHLRVHRLKRKWLYRRSLEGIVPPEALARRKAPFATPYDAWLRSGLGAEVERAYAPGTALGALLRPAAVSRLVAEHRSGAADHKRLLYCLLELAAWHRRFLEAGEPASALAPTSR